MKAYSHFVYIICCIYRYTILESKPELKKNIFKLDYGINYKYEEMLAHSFDRIYVVTKFILSTVSDINFSKFNFEDNCKCLRKRNKEQNYRIEKCILDLIDCRRKIKPYVH